MVLLFPPRCKLAKFHDPRKQCEWVFIDSCAVPFRKCVCDLGGGFADSTEQQKEERSVSAPFYDDFTVPTGLCDGVLTGATRRKSVCAAQSP